MIWIQALGFKGFNDFHTYPVDVPLIGVKKVLLVRRNRADVVMELSINGVAEVNRFAPGTILHAEAHIKIRMLPFPLAFRMPGIKQNITLIESDPGMTRTVAVHSDS